MIKDVIQKVRIDTLDINDPFFQSLRDDYNGFDNWFLGKANEEAYIFRENDVLDGFLYLKDEDEETLSINPNFEKKRRLKIGTFKINSHGTVLGQRFLSIILNKMFEEEHDFTYVTLFEKQKGLISLFETFGFKLWGTKDNLELVYYKDNELFNDIYKDYPLVNLENNTRKYLLSIYPQYHTKMFPASKLKTETNHLIEDLSFTNTIEKTYIAGMSNISYIKSGDLIVIYRTKDNAATSAEYSSVATSICTVVDTKHMDEFSTVGEYLKYCGKGSIFSEQELKKFFNTKRYPYIIKMLYNFPLKKRIIRQDLINNVGLGRNQYFGVLQLTNTQFKNILEIGEVNEGFVID